MEGYYNNILTNTQTSLKQWAAQNEPKLESLPYKKTSRSKTKIETVKRDTKRAHVDAFIERTPLTATAENRPRRRQRMVQAIARQQQHHPVGTGPPVFDCTMHGVAGEPIRSPVYVRAAPLLLRS